ncbi:hypothetical protein Tco_1229994 [Tanacetum coccineum]
MFRSLFLKFPSLSQDSEWLDNSIMAFIPAVGVILRIGPLKSTFRLVKGKAISITWSLDTLGEWKRSMMSVILEMCSWGSSFSLLKNMFSFNSSIHCAQNSKFKFSSNRVLIGPGPLSSITFVSGKTQTWAKFIDEKADDKISYLVTSNGQKRIHGISTIRRKKVEEMDMSHSSEDDEADFLNLRLKGAINFNENRSFPDDEFLESRSKVTQCPGNIEYFPYKPAYENTTPTDSPILQDSVSSEEPPEFNC